MKIFIQQRLGFTDLQYTASITITDEAGNLLAELQSEYTRTNAIYPAYKSFQRAIPIAQRLGATSIELNTNIESFSRELAGNRNKNSALYDQTMSRLSGIKIASITLDTTGGDLIAG